MTAMPTTSRRGDHAWAGLEHHGLPLLAALVAVYAAWLGGGREWNNQMGQYWARLDPWLPSLRLEP